MPIAKITIEYETGTNKTSSDSHQCCRKSLGTILWQIPTKTGLNFGDLDSGNCSRDVTENIENPIQY